jgi:hypothetical protein
MYITLRYHIMKKDAHWVIHAARVTICTVFSTKILPWNPTFKKNIDIVR